MSIAKVVEIIGEGKSIEDAIEGALNGTGETVRNIKAVWVEGIQANVKDGKIKEYRVNTKITFVVGERD
ncbi:MAG: dodecin domain-containing protein [Gemmatimonadetes bacterium]|nr:dodecin domain-containing protein [Gemmatimonadota bacterium]NNM33462.1 dodecin domain-containing protein [Gemmatimonadota bacterium]